MTSTLHELCKYMQHCTEKLEEEIKRNIDNCHKLLLDNEATEIKLALEKAKDYHFKEILDILNVIVTNIKKVIFHEEKIRSLSDEEAMSLEELKRYSHVQRQVSVYSNNEKREKRRVASEISIGSLEAWEQYLEKKKEEETLNEAEKSEMSKRKRPTGRRRKKKLVSSTFNNFLDYRTGGRSLDSILEGDTKEEPLNTNSDSKESDGRNFSLESSLGYDKSMVDSNNEESLEEILKDMHCFSFDSSREDVNLEIGEVSQRRRRENNEPLDGSIHLTGDEPKVVDVVVSTRL
ncbi:hypothetical protein NQ317_005592 [Molorchus minor]|uniref:Uncharacterized protein n=1 Tax=Molorchus minor TaxID=1323400 RepID=A0ABQ9K9A8_9CUCU|nr:hypothetical protein NQ317_005592 [Molorchus minor]